MKVHVISAEIYRDHLGDSTNGGMSSRHKEVLIIVDRGLPLEFDENNPPENLVVLETGFMGRKYLRPFKSADPNKTGYMFGGNFAYSSDSRFPFDYPLGIYDRQDTWEEYEMLTR